MSLTSDIGAVLPLIQTPTLALHPRDQQLVPAEAVREFTELIPGARFREMPGDAGLIFALDVGLLADMIEEFVTGRAAGAGHESRPGDGPCSPISSTRPAAPLNWVTTHGRR